MAITYKYSAINLSGNRVNGRKTFDNPDELIEYLRENDLYCVEYAESKAKKERVKYKYKNLKLASFSRQLSSMLAAGITLVRAIHMLYVQEDKKYAKEALRDIYDEVQRGRSFSEALAAKEGVFPKLFISMVAAGESSGSLEIVMRRLSSHYSKEAKLRNTVTRGMIYPAILGVLMVAVVIALFTFIMPTFMGLFQSQDDVPAMTKFVMGISDFCTQRWYVLVGIAVVLVVGMRILLKVPAFKLWFDRVKCKMPKVGKLMMTIYTSRFARTLSNLFASGIQMVDCLEMSVDTLGNTYINKLFVTVIEDVKRGESMSEAIAKTDLFDNIFTSTLYTGEESGKLDEILDYTADDYDEQADSAVAKLVAMLEPCMIIIMGVVIMLVLLAVFPAMYQSFQGLAA